MIAFLLQKMLQKKASAAIVMWVCVSCVGASQTPKNVQKIISHVLFTTFKSGIMCASYIYVYAYM